MERRRQQNRFVVEADIDNHSDFSSHNKKADADYVPSGGEESFSADDDDTDEDEIEHTDVLPTGTRQNLAVHPQHVWLS